MSLCAWLGNGCDQLPCLDSSTLAFGVKWLANGWVSLLGPEPPVHIRNTQAQLAVRYASLLPDLETWGDKERRKDLEMIKHHRGVVIGGIDRQGVERRICRRGRVASRRRTW